MIEGFIQKVAREEPGLEVMFLPGDFVGHAICIPEGQKEVPELYE